jgi:hypothetical protein
MEAKRMLSIQSVFHWGHNILENLTDQLYKGCETGEVVQELRTLLDEQMEAIYTRLGLCVTELKSFKK